jgi:predicted XRE-type DNA-binding protein
MEKIISDINKVIKIKRISEQKISDLTGIPQSTVSSNNTTAWLLGLMAIH